MKIIVDAFGGDNAPLEVIKGSRSAKDDLGVDIALVGDKEKIFSCAAQNKISLRRYRMGGVLETGAFMERGIFSS